MGMIRTVEKVELLAGFGCTYRKTRRTAWLFGLVPLSTRITRERLPHR